MNKTDYILRRACVGQCEVLLRDILQAWGSNSAPFEEASKLLTYLNGCASPIYVDEND